MSDGRRTIGGKTYTFNADGTMVTGWQEIKSGPYTGKWFYYNADGAMATGWAQVKGNGIILMHLVSCKQAG